MKKLKKILGDDKLFTVIVILFLIICFNIAVSLYMHSTAWKKCLEKYAEEDCEVFFD